jgi:hypothetical protein
MMRNRNGSAARIAGIVGIAGVMIAPMAISVVAAGAAPAHRSVAATRKPAKNFSLLSAPQSFTSSTHKHLRITVNAVGGPTELGPGTVVYQIPVSLTVSRKGALETHNWEFIATGKKVFTYNSITGKGVLRTGSAMKPFGSMTLRITATGRTRFTGCGGSRQAVRAAKLKGTFSFDTRSTGASKWGKVGSSHPRTFTGHSTMSYLASTDKQCPMPLPCNPGMSWQAQNITSAGDAVTLVGSAIKVGAKTRYTLSGDRQLPLAKPSGAFRTDDITISLKRMPFTFKGTSAKVGVPSSGAALTGAATLTSTSENPVSTLFCGPKLATMQTDTHWPAAFKNAKKALSLNEQIEGAFKVPNLTGSIDRITVS